MAPLKDSEQKELLSLEEETYEMEGFTYSEILMMRQLVNGLHLLITMAMPMKVLRFQMMKLLGMLTKEASLEDMYSS